MIIYTNVDIFDSGADILVCPVNCVGTLGAGLAKQFKTRFPELDDKYQSVLRSGHLYINHPYIVHVNGQEICLFPTKWHWREPSRLQWIGNGLWVLASEAQRRIRACEQPKSIAVPKLGCGLGGLAWSDVRKLIESHLADYEGTVYVMGSIA